MKRPARGRAARARKAARPGKAAPTKRSLARGTTSPDVGRLFERIVSILEGARVRVARSVNSEMVLAYWQIGSEIVEHIQKGSKRAEYGESALTELSAQLQARIGKGYSVTNLRYFRLFYQTYSEREPTIRHKPCDELVDGTKKHHTEGDVSIAKGGRSSTTSGVLKDLERAAASEKGLQGFSARLSWSHYRALTKVEHPAARAFYEIEAEREQWSVPHLERQIHTQLFARLLKSRDKAGVMDPASRGQALDPRVDVAELSVEAGRRHNLEAPALAIPAGHDDRLTMQVRNGLVVEPRAESSALEGALAPDFQVHLGGPKPGFHPSGARAGLTATRSFRPVQTSQAFVRARSGS